MLKEKEIAAICYKLLKEIEELHGRGIIHRDIKCLFIILLPIFVDLLWVGANIVFDEHFNARLIDYEFSECRNNCSPGPITPVAKGNPTGTHCHMAPEVINNIPYSNKIDIWSFGVSVIEMITGRELYRQWIFPDYYI